MDVTDTTAVIGGSEANAAMTTGLPVFGNLSNLTFLLDVSNGNGTATCDEWLGAQHVLFQLANLCFCVSFLTPSSCKYHALFLRAVLSFGCLFLVIWGASVDCHVDVLTWYLAFLIVNVSHLGFIIFSLYPVSLHPDLEDLYSRSFKPLKVTRGQFKELSGHGKLSDLHIGASYAVESATLAGQKVSILLSGRLKVSYGELFLHHIEPNQFVDSAEYEAVPPHSEDEETFQVSIGALEDSRLLVWPAEQLQQYLKSKPFLTAVFTNLVGKDITTKLYQVQELLLSNPDHLKVLASRNSIVQLRHRLSQSLSSHNMNLDLDSISNDNCSGTSSESPLKRQRVPTPVGPYSPSQVSFETCV